MDAGISSVTALLGAFSYFFRDLLSMYYCNEKLYTSNFGKCVEPYEQWGLTLTILFSSISFVFAILILLKDKRLYRTYLKIFATIISVGAFVTILSWDGSGGGFINLNFGPMFLALTGIVFVSSVFAIAWSHLFKSRIRASLFFLILVSTLLYYNESLHIFSEQIMFGNTNDTKECKDIKLYRINDKCLFHKGVTENNIEVCDLISANSLDFKKDCRDFIFRNRGSHGGDKKWCSFITSNYQKKLCYD